MDTDIGLSGDDCAMYRLCDERKQGYRTRYNVGFTEMPS